MDRDIARLLAFVWQAPDVEDSLADRYFAHDMITEKKRRGDLSRQAIFRSSRRRDELNLFRANADDHVPFILPRRRYDKRSDLRVDSPVGKRFTMQPIDRTEKLGDLRICRRSIQC